MILELTAIRKSFGGVHALRDGTLEVGAGQVHALLGENGAGKSTLVKIVAGMLRRDGGAMRWHGRSVDFAKPAEAHAVGIHMVHQEPLLAPNLTVAENVFLGREFRKGMLVNQAAMQRVTSALLREHRFPLEADQLVGKLSVAHKQLVEICRALYGDASLLIFDEPTSSLSDAEAGLVFRIVRQLRERGIGIIYITHRLAELGEVADHVTILRDGETVRSCAADSVSVGEIVQHMVGRSISTTRRRKPVPPGEERLGVSLPGVSFAVRRGEIVGMAGLVGAGRTAVCETVFGIRPAPPGAVTVNGETRAIRSPEDAVRAGIALVTEDRQETGLAVRLAVRVNATLAHLGAVCLRSWIQARRERRVARKYMERLNIRSNAAEQPTMMLSGGNQQKVVIAKWLFRDPDVVLFDEPTRGIDVAAKEEVFSLMDEMARAGKAILMVSSELPELLQVADRILVMREGALVAKLPRDTTQREIMHHAAVGG